MIDDDQAEAALAAVDLHRWHVPPPPVGQRRAILDRALAPPAVPRRRRRIVAVLIGFAVVNAVAAAIIALVVAGAAGEPARVAPRPAGPPTAIEARLEARSREIRELRRQLDELAENLRRQQRALEDSMATLRKREAEIEALQRAIGLPPRRTAPSRLAACDEVRCLLEDYARPCCARFERDHGYLVVKSMPIARVFVDGKYTGKSTPIAGDDRIRLRAGEHMVSFVLDDARHHFKVTIEGGKTTTLVKQFPR